MRLLIVLTLVASAIAESYEKAQYYQYRGPPAPLSNDGMVVDTPEVASARAAHLAMHAETMARLRKAQNEYEVYENNEMYTPPPNPPAMPKRQRQRSFAPIGRDGRVVDTPEVAEAKAAHLEAHARAASKASAFYELDVYDGHRNLVYLAPVRVTYTHLSPMGYRGPAAPLGPDGRVIDTPEVTRAREAHMKAHARAVALTMHDDDYWN